MDMTGMFAFSRAGHDKGRLYFVISEEDEYVYLVDGDLRPVEKPKKAYTADKERSRRLSVSEGKGCTDHI